MSVAFIHTYYSPNQKEQERLAQLQLDISTARRNIWKNALTRPNPEIYFLYTIAGVAFKVRKSFKVLLGGKGAINDTQSSKSMLS